MYRNGYLLNLLLLIFFVTVIMNPKALPGNKEPPKSFNFDFSYWSHNVSIVIYPKY